MTPRGIRAGLTALVLSAGLAASGCGNPLADLAEPGGAARASASPSPSPTAAALPQAGECHGSPYVQQVDSAGDPVVDCAAAHKSETVYVGRFVGTSAAGNVPRLNQSGTDSAAVEAIQNEAYMDCSGHADEYLGHSWIHMLLELRITLPTDAAWTKGDRWYRCDLFQVDWATSDDTDRTGSLKTTWFAAVCLDVNKDGNPIVACSKKHPSEFAGGYLAPPTVKEPKSAAQYKPYHQKCYTVIGSYLGISGSKVHTTVGDSIFFQNDFADWASGRRAVWCLTWTGEKTSTYVTGSAQGRKGKGL